MRLALPFVAALGLAAVPAAAQDATALDLFVRADKGHCIACHQLPAGSGPETRADVGPKLEGARMRELGGAAIRDLVADPVRLNASTVMPPYGRHQILAEREIARIAEFLLALP